MDEKDFHFDMIEIESAKLPMVAILLDADRKALAHFNISPTGGMLEIDTNDYPTADRLEVFDADDLLERERRLDPATAWCDCDRDTTDEGVKLGRHFIQNIPGTPVIIHYHRDYEAQVVTMLQIEGGRR